MEYCIADIHAHYDLFCRLMDKIRFSDGDTLYVMGDIIEKGPDSIRLAKLLFSLPNVKAVIGNHEHVFLNYYHNLMRQTEDYGSVLQKLKDYFPDGELLDWETVDAFDALPYYIETENFIGVHAGIPVKDGRLTRLEEATENQLVYDRTFKEPDVLPSGGKCVFFGHTPTWYVTGGKSEILFYPREGTSAGSGNIRDYCKVHLDLDTCKTGLLGCVAVETCECFYVSGRQRSVYD